MGRIFADCATPESTPATTPPTADPYDEPKENLASPVGRHPSGRRVMLWRNSSITQRAAVTTRIQRTTGGARAMDASSQPLPSTIAVLRLDLSDHRPNGERRPGRHANLRLPLGEPFDRRPR